MKIILQNKDNLRFTNIYLFKNGKCIQILDNINYLKTVEQILSIDPAIEYVVVHLPRTGARLDIINSLNNKDKNYQFFLDYPSSHEFQKISIRRKPDGGPLHCPTRASETEVEIMKTLLNEIESIQE